MNKKLLIIQLSFGMALLLLWECLVRFFPGKLDPNLFGQPVLIFKSFIGYAKTGLLMKDTITTLIESICGLGIGMILGLGLGAFLASFEVIYKILEPYIVALNSLPRPALAPIFLLWFGLGMTSKIFVSVSLVFFIVFFNTFSGIKSIDKDLINAVRVTGASKLKIFQSVTLPSIYTWLFAGFRTSVSYSLIGSVVGEFVGASRGLGYRMFIATGVMDTHLAFAILIWLSLIGVSVVTIGIIIEKRMLKWKYFASGGQRGLF